MNYARRQQYRRLSHAGKAALASAVAALLGLVGASDATRLGFAVQLGTVRHLGRFLEDPAAVPAG